MTARPHPRRLPVRVRPRTSGGTVAAPRLSGPLAAVVTTALALVVAAAVADPAGRDWSSADLAWRDDPRPPADAPYGVDAPPSRWPTRRAQRRAAASSRRRGVADAADLEPQPPAPAARSAVNDGVSPARPPFADTLVPPLGARLPPGVCPVPGPRADAVPGLPSWETPAFGAEMFSASGEAAPAIVERPLERSTAGGPGAVPAAGDRPAATAATVVSHRDQPYAAPSMASAPGPVAHGRHRFDLHRPAGCSAGGMPLVVWIHGDSWREGSKADCPIVWMADEGYVVASVGYRLSDAAVFPAQLDDCRAAIDQIVRDADVWGIDPARVAVAGSGGGGHLAALVGLVRETAATATGEAAVAGPRIAAVCAVAAPANLTTLGPEHDRAGSSASRLVGGPLPEFREKAQRASPMSHVSPDDPPVLLIHGAADATVPPRQAAEFDQALRAAGVDSTLVLLPGVGHKPALGRGTPAGLSLLMFLDRTLGAGVRASPAAALPGVPSP